MTENEAKEWIKYLGNKNLPYDRSPKSRKLACDIAIQALEKVQKFEAIGTVEEFKELKEKTIAKKVISRNSIYRCPHCETTVSVTNTKCAKCGQALDWQRKE